jgi:glycosyltransferase involved in cell wall biosynthesis
MTTVNRAPPVVSVVISTFNWSSVLRYAIASVLAQSFADFELLVVGDCCTDDSEAVVKSFDDPRIRWHNLAEHAGGQFGPSNRGVALARGRYIAYLGHDDLWHRDHLAVLVDAIESHQADLVFAITEEIGPPAMPTRGLLGLAPKGVYEWSLWAPPSSWLHRRDLVERVGPWRDSRTIVLTTDWDLLNRFMTSVALSCRSTS